MIYFGMPAYNEAANLPELLDEIRQVVEEWLPTRDVTVVVVDDGSADATADVVQGFAKHLDRARCPRLAVRLLAHGVNRGLPAALRTLLTHVAEVGGRRDVLVTMDADNSHRPGLALAMLQKIAEGHDVVCASRYRPGGREVGLTFFRSLLSLCASWMFRIVFPIKNVRDYTCGYRALRVEVLQEALRADPNFVSERGFSCTVDVLLKLRALRPLLLVAEVPMVLRYDKKAGASKMSVGRTVWATLSLVLRRRLGRLT